MHVSRYDDSGEHYDEYYDVSELEYLPMNLDESTAQISFYAEEGAYWYAGSYTIHAMITYNGMEVEDV